jgi:hypothetical protein
MCLEKAQSKAAALHDTLEMKHLRSESFKRQGFHLPLGLNDSTERTWSVRLCLDGYGFNGEWIFRYTTTHAWIPMDVIVQLVASFAENAHCECVRRTRTELGGFVRYCKLVYFDAHTFAHTFKSF